jgi:hypothetical protein
MNEPCALQEKTAEPARPYTSASTPAGQQPHQDSGRLSSAEIAQKVMKLTGNVRLISRSAHHWHHCGINE